MNYSNYKLKHVIINDISKKFNVIKKGILSLLVLGLTFISCSTNDEVTETEAVTQDITEVQRSAEIDQIDTILEDLVIDAYEQQEFESADRIEYTQDDSERETYSRDIPECVTITLVAQQNYREITLDFGTEGCVVNGHLIQGQIVFDYTRNPEAQEISINYNLIDFYFKRII